MSILDTTKFVERLRQTLKDVKSFKNDGKGVSFNAETRLNYLLNRCNDIVRDYDVDLNNKLEEFWGDDKKKNEHEEKEKAEDKTYE